MSRRLLIALAAVLLGAATLAGGSSAQPSLQLSQTRNAEWPLRGFVLSLPSGQRLQPSRVSVLENGQPVLRPSVRPVSKAQGNFGVVLVIDASNSMRGAPIKGAMAAARAFASRRNVNQLLAVYTFNSGEKLLLPFTGSQARINDALRGTPHLANGTHLYDAVAQAIQLIRSTSFSSGAVVLLSDGADTGSKNTLDQVAGLAAGTHVRVFTVGLRSKTFRPGALRRLAASSGGSYSEASSPKELAGIYDQLGLKLANEYFVTYRSLVEPGHPVRVTVSVGGIGSAKTRYLAPTIAPPSFSKPASDRVWQSWVTMMLVCLLAAGLVGLGLFAALRPSESTVRSRLSDFVSTARPAQENPSDPLATRLFAETERSLQRTRWWRSYKDALELAEVSIHPVQLLAGTLVLTLLVMWFFGTFVAGPLLLLGLAVPFIVRSLIQRRIETKRRAFADQLPDNLEVLSSGLKAGHSLVGALSLVVNDAPEPSRTEFQRVVADEQLGVPLEDSLTVVARRMKSRDVEQVALVASLQRETGSSSAEVLDRVTDAIRERAELRRLVRSLTAQGRLSRWIVSFLPVGLLVIITAINPGYMKPLFTHTSGRIVLAIGALMIVSGSLVIKRIVDIKV